MRELFGWIKLELFEYESVNCKLKRCKLKYIPHYV